MSIELQLRPTSSSFALKIFSFPHGVPATIELDGYADDTPLPAPDNAIFPSVALAIDQAFIDFTGSSFTLRSFDENSRNVCVNGQLLRTCIHTLVDGDLLEFGIYKPSHGSFKIECAAEVRVVDHLRSSHAPTGTNWIGIRDLVDSIRQQSDFKGNRTHHQHPTPSSTSHPLPLSTSTPGSDPLPPSSGPTPRQGIPIPTAYSSPGTAGARPLASFADESTSPVLTSVLPSGLGSITDQVHEHKRDNAMAAPGRPSAALLAVPSRSAVPHPFTASPTVSDIDQERHSPVWPPDHNQAEQAPQHARSSASPSDYTSSASMPCAAAAFFAVSVSESVSTCDGPTPVCTSVPCAAENELTRTASAPRTCSSVDISTVVPKITPPAVNSVSTSVLTSGLGAPSDQVRGDATNVSIGGTGDDASSATSSIASPVSITTIPRPSSSVEHSSSSSTCSASGSAQYQEQLVSRLDTVPARRIGHDTGAHSTATLVIGEPGRPQVRRRTIPHHQSFTAPVSRTTTSPHSCDGLSSARLAVSRTWDACVEAQTALLSVRVASANLALARIRMALSHARGEVAYAALPLPTKPKISPSKPRSAVTPDGHWYRSGTPDASLSPPYHSIPPVDIHAPDVAFAALTADRHGAFDHRQTLFSPHAPSSLVHRELLAVMAPAVTHLYRCINFVTSLQSSFSHNYAVHYNPQLHPLHHTSYLPALFPIWPH